MSSTHPNEIAIPDELHRDAQAQELVRVWSSEDRQTFVINATSMEDPAAWGIIALDMMKHAARAYAHAGAGAKGDVYKRILAGFAAEMQNPTEPL